MKEVEALEDLYNTLIEINRDDFEEINKFLRKAEMMIRKIFSVDSQYLLDLKNIKLQVNILLDNTLTDFENQQQLLKIETENNELALENIKISLERLRLGQTTSLEVHIAQEDFVQSNTRLINFRYNLKLAETKLKQLVSGL